mgnify:CR=1 FL=1
MAFFKIEKTGCSERKGLCQVRFDLFLEEGDPQYADFYVQIPEVDKNGKETGKTMWVNTPFCCHFCQFEPTVTDEEILYVGELALEMASKNHKLGNLHLNKNIPVTFSADTKKKSDCAKRIEGILETDFTKIEIKSKIPYSVRK